MRCLQGLVPVSSFSVAAGGCAPAAAASATGTPPPAASEATGSRARGGYARPDLVYPQHLLRHS